MAYVINTSDGINVSIQDGLMSIPLDPANRHYQEVLDAVIAQGADCWDGDIPADIQAAADAKLAAGLYQPDPHA